MSWDTRNEFSVDGWKIDLDIEKEFISISHKKLGVVLDNVKLYAIVDNAGSLLTGWDAKNVVNKLIIKTSEPIDINWEFILSENDVDIRTSADNTYISALAPAPKNRFPSRIADPANMLVHETGEDNDYTGVTQIEKYYVPPENPQVMYLSLGAIDSPNLCSMFDKSSNTVIQFSPDTRLKRWADDQSFMQVITPLGKNRRLLHLIQKYYTDVLGMPNYIPYDDTYHTTAPTGWNHWLAFFRQVTEKDIVDHAEFIAANLKPYGMIHCQLDDGYDKPDRRLWNKNWDPDKFPHGPEWLAQYIKSKGLIPGLWTVPYCYSVKDANPDWFLRDDEGNILMDYQGGGELDFTRPDVIREYWIPLWKEFKRQGWEYYKFDMGNTSWMWFHYQHNFSDTSKSSYDVSQETMTIYREIMGPEIWHTNHPDVYGGRMGFIDVAGCGRDPAPGWKQMNNFLEVISNNAYQNHIVWYSDPDCIVLRGKPTRADSGYWEGDDYYLNNEFLTLEEARTCASLLSLSGMQFLNGDDLLNLEEERLDIIKKTIPIMPIFPIDLFGRGRHRKHYPEIMDLKINAPSGVYDVITVTNWENKNISRKVLINDELCLDSTATYLVFDNWKEQLVGIFKNEFQADLPIHGTRVFTIRRQAEHPQLLATNRHITGALSITNKSWNYPEMTVSGVSETVPGANYSLFFYVPPQFSVDIIDADAKDLSYQLDKKGLLRIIFTGQENPTNWNLKFSNK
jgi:hypothetical protein